MGTTLQLDDVVNDLEEVWQRLLEIGGEIPDSMWNHPTSCPNWSIADNYAHIIGTEAMLAGEAQPKISGIDMSIVKNPIGEMNQHWVESMRSMGKAELLDRLSKLKETRSKRLRSMTPEEWETPGPTPVGQAPYGRFMQIRVFDCYMHEQDIRQAADLGFHPYGGAAERSFAEITPAMGFVVGKKANAPKGSIVRFVISGGQNATFDVIVGDRASISYDLSHSPTTVLEIGFLAFTRLIGGRSDGGADYISRITVSGDKALGERVLANLNYLI